MTTKDNRRIGFRFGGGAIVPVLALALALVALLVLGLGAGWALVRAQDQAQEGVPTPLPTTFLGKVAANLGVDEARLIDAIFRAKLQTVDEAVAQGRLTPEQAERIKQGITSSQTLLQLIEEAEQQGRLTPDQAARLRQRLVGGFGLGFGPKAWGFHGHGFGFGHRGWGR